jgi:hypothetical protein
MNSYKAPIVPTISNPVNIDKPIQVLQIALAGLPWLEKSFGRSFMSVKKNEGSQNISYYPQVWQGPGLDLLEVMPNDNLKAQSFFKVEEPIECLQFSPNGYSLMQARVSIIFWFNLQRIDPQKNFDYSYAEILKGSAQRILTNVTLDGNDAIKILRVWETPKNVFSGYTLQDVRDQELIYPYGGFRFECNLVYIENCPDEVYAVPPV